MANRAQAAFGPLRAPYWQVEHGRFLFGEGSETRDEAGNIIQQVRGSDSMNTYWNYDQANRISTEAWLTSAQANVYGFNYSYDAEGNRIFKQDTVLANTTYWEYDLADQLSRQRSGSPVTVYFYFDQNGNLSTEQDATAGLTYYWYESRNLLSRVLFPGGSPATNYFSYNGLSERVRKDDSTAQKKYTWDGIDVVVEKNLSNVTTQRLVKGYTAIGGIGAYVLQDLSGTVIYPHKNQVGTTMRHTDSTGALKNTYEYDAWGQPFVVTEGAGASQQYRFTGKELDPDNILFNVNNRRYHFLFRQYVPFRGVLLQADPAQFAMRRNLAKLLLSYNFGNSAPNFFVDPDGRDFIALGSRSLEGIAGWFTKHGALEFWCEPIPVFVEGEHWEGTATRHYAAIREDQYELKNINNLYYGDQILGLYGSGNPPFNPPPNTLKWTLWPVSFIRNTSNATEHLVVYADKNWGAGSSRAWWYDSIVFEATTYPWAEHLWPGGEPLVNWPNSWYQTDPTTISPPGGGNNSWTFIWYLLDLIGRGGWADKLTGGTRPGNRTPQNVSTSPTLGTPILSNKPPGPPPSPYGRL